MARSLFSSISVDSKGCISGAGCFGFVFCIFAGFGCVLNGFLSVAISFCRRVVGAFALSMRFGLLGAFLPFDISLATLSAEGFVRGRLTSF
jgi:hypothetical protein